MIRRQREPAHHEAERRFRDAGGVTWLVSEREASGQPPALYFQAEMAFRRVAHYPFNWRELSTAELELLSCAN